MVKRALLIIDMQNGLFHAANKPFQAREVLSHINQLIDKARQANAPVFAIRHTGPIGSPIEPGSPLTQLIPELNIDISKDRLLDKTRPNCFIGTALAAKLRQEGIDELVITGMKTEFCIDTTCRAAAELGFNPILISDAHTTVNNSTLAAETIIAHHNQILAGVFVKLISSADCTF